MRRRSAAMVAAALEAIARAIGPDELQLGAALGLIAFGCWYVWKPAAALVPGAVLLWIALPTRKTFIARPPEIRKRRSS